MGRKIDKTIGITGAIGVLFMVISFLFIGHYALQESMGTKFEHPCTFLLAGFVLSSAAYMADRIFD